MSAYTAYPLSWPTGWPRASTRKASRFPDRISVAQATDGLSEELRLLGVPDWDWILSTNLELRLDGLPRSNQRAPADPGVAVYFNLRDRKTGKREPRVLACDCWNRVEHNIRAITKHIEALRGMDRWGVGSVEQAFSGYKALPAPGESTARPWWTVLNCDQAASEDVVRARYRAAVLETHPDRLHGDRHTFEQVTAAWSEFKRERGL